MLQPARRKYRKEQKGRIKGVASRGAKVSFGEYGLKALGRGRLDSVSPPGAPRRPRARWYQDERAAIRGLSGVARFSGWVILR